MEVTVTGGTGNPAIALQYVADTTALVMASNLAASISNKYSSATYYSQSGNPSVSGVDYLIATQSAIGSATIDASGYKAVVIQNTGVAATVLGGGSTRQTVLASNGGLTFSLSSTVGNTTVVAGGGANSISFAGSTGKDAVYTTNGNDTIVGGDGATTIKAGGGQNAVTIGGGSTYDVVSGNDSIQLGSGTETVRVVGMGSATIDGAPPHSVTVSPGQFSLDFIGKGMASTVLSGAGRYSIQGGAGGGLFEGGSDGGNVIRGGTGSLTIFGAGNGDILQAGSGASSIVAGAGNETLIGANHGGSATLTGGSGQDIFVFRPDGSMAPNTDVVKGFAEGIDFLKVSAYGLHYGVNEINYALHHQTLADGNATVTLSDGTKITVDGVAHLLTSGDFK